VNLLSLLIRFRSSI